jgi:hypothetical protein
MRKWWTIGVLVIVVMLGLPPAAACAEGQGSAREQFDTIRARLSSGEVARVEILQIPKGEMKFALVTPEMVELAYFYKFTINEVAMKKEQGALLEAVNSATITVLEKMPDLRWGLIFYDRRGNRLGAMYFNELGNYGAVGESPVAFTGDLFHWIERNFSGCFK